MHSSSQKTGKKKNNKIESSQLEAVTPKMRGIVEWQVWSRWGEIKTWGFVNWDSENEKRLKEAYWYSDPVRSKICPRAKSWNYFSASYHNLTIKERKKGISTLYKHFPPFLFFLTSDFPPLWKLTACKVCLNFRCSLSVLFLMKFFLLYVVILKQTKKAINSLN